MKRKNSTRLAVMTALLLAAGLSSTVQAAEGVAKIKEFQFDKPVDPVAAANHHNSKKVKPSISSFPSKSRERVATYEEADFWIFDSWTSVSADYDYDGYYTWFSVEFDADTVYANVPVYAVIYLGDEQSFQSVHVSSVFHIYGEDSNDSFVVETELVTGYAPYEYDVMVELYDANTDELIAMTDGYDDADLAFLSLESNDYDEPYVEEETVVVVEQHGGALTLPVLAGLMGFIYWRRRIAQRPATIN
ncbi:hypothetical protein CA267_004755 [Alteromonas pelagimontana]|uniref:GlyGly-CTERM sorting domain-containing protein n=1 Tax=Alteromonas pelagimontana TaxID=1858656 RepID=A0A6M4MDC4_9ALTE|nr:choice-of-anchor H family protein [Alteromonas pelagimontana]QJR80136.1 hypothetical protein CA267_004755 [Alteromonas pelagimontana]